MVAITSPHVGFKLRIREFFHTQTECRPINIPNNSLIYTSAQDDSMVYFIEKGQVKLVLPTDKGKECLLSICTSGDIFGELCLSGQARLETAVTMQDTKLIRMPYRSFLKGLAQRSLLESFVQYLTIRIAEQQEIITAMATTDSEHRLAMTLLYLSRKLGREDYGGTCIEHRISHLELSEMVGTTRPRVGILLKKFREIGLIHLTKQHHLVIDQSKVEQYLANTGFAEDRWKKRADNSGLAEPDEGDLKFDSIVPFYRDPLMMWAPSPA